MDNIITDEAFAQILAFPSFTPMVNLVEAETAWLTGLRNLANDLLRSYQVRNQVASREEFERDIVPQLAAEFAKQPKFVDFMPPAEPDPV